MEMNVPERPAVERQSTARLPTRHSVFTAHGYVDRLTGHEHVAIVMGPVAQRPRVQVDARSYAVSGHILQDIGVRSVRLTCSIRRRRTGSSGGMCSGGQVRTPARDLASLRLT